MNQEILKQKSDCVAEIGQNIKDSNAFIICEYRGLSVAELTKLRKSLLAKESSLFVYKNTLVKRALESLDIKDLNSYLEGPNAFIFSKDISNGPKIAAKFSRLNENLVIKAGYIEGRSYGKDEVIAISKLPNREGLLSMFLSVLQAPVRQFACTVKAVAEQK